MRKGKVPQCAIFMKSTLMGLRTVIVNLSNPNSVERHADWQMVAGPFDMYKVKSRTGATVWTATNETHELRAQIVREKGAIINVRSQIVLDRVERDEAPEEEQGYVQVRQMEAKIRVDESHWVWATKPTELHDNSELETKQ